jgi:hypothetical protein
MRITFRAAALKTSVVLAMLAKTTRNSGEPGALDMVSEEAIQLDIDP